MTSPGTPRVMSSMTLGMPPMMSREVTRDPRWASEDLTCEPMIDLTDCLHGAPGSTGTLAARGELDANGTRSTTRTGEGGLALTRNRGGHTATYTEMLELLGGSSADGPPPSELERFEAVMGMRRNPRNGAPMHYSEQERECMIRRVLAEHLVRHPEVASKVPRLSAPRLKVRFPRTLYREIGDAAQADGTSMNTLVVAACAAYLGRRAAMQSSGAPATAARETLSEVQPWGEHSG